ncbi:protein-L-isoaspartate(D-aspartate) O-methyltransferase [Rhizobiales bacterium GAS188]|nr:protein-L-isoaspartate(D-aspartate) O-methyltransferase [Rhizobiales bacterium GAS188]
MDRQGELSIIRAAYAKQILAAAGVDDARLGAAFGTMRREDFLGPGPWPILRWLRDYVLTPDSDPVYLYTDDLIGILPERRINNGQPSLHAHLIHRASPGVGERVVHIGTGTGYYTAILAYLAGPSGRVTGIEYDSELAARAKANLAPHPNVDIVAGDGALVSFGEADVIYVNAGCTRPAESWLDRLAEGGRLILPMTSDQGFGAASPERMASAGAVFRIERRGHDYFATWISPVAIFPFAGSRDEVSEHALAEAFAKGGWQQITRLYRDQEIAEERCWLRGSGWCLAYS